MTPIVLPLVPPPLGDRQAAGEPLLTGARVLQAVADGTWLVSIGDETLTVRSDRPLEVGEKVLVATARERRPEPAGETPHPPPAASAPPIPVSRAEVLPRLLDALASQASATPAHPAVALAAKVVRALDGIPRPPSVPEQALAELRAVLRPVAAPHEPAVTADVLKRAVEDTGALFEAKTARLMEATPGGTPRLPAGDLRTLVGTVLSRLAPDGRASVPSHGPAAPAPAEMFRAALIEAGQSALATQVQAAAHAEAHGVWRVEIPLQFGHRCVHLDCEFEPDRDARGGRGTGTRSGQLHVLVTPEAATPLEARFSWQAAEAIAIDVYVDTEARAAALAAGREALADRLRAAGFADASVDVWVNPARLARWATRRPPAPRAGTALDTHA